MSRPSMCGSCGDCDRCTRAVYMREWWSRFTPEEKRRKTATRNPDLVREQARRKMARRRAEGTPQQLERLEVYKQVKQAKLDGRLLVGACEMGPAGCGGRMEAHHKDYTKPLDVHWLCNAHHKENHA